MIGNLIKTLLLAFLCLTCVQENMSQIIPNGDFEDWAERDSLLEPVYWQTDNIQDYITVSKDISFESLTCVMRITGAVSSPSGTLPGQASCTIEQIDTIITGVGVLIRNVIDIKGKATIEIVALRDSVPIQSELFIMYRNESVPDWKYMDFELENPINTTMVDSVVIRLQAGPDQFGSYYLANSVLWIDYVELYASPITSVTNYHQYIDLEIFPNPATENFTIHIPENIRGDSGRLIVNTTQGHEIKNIQLLSIPGSIDIDCSDWPPGIYFGRLGTSDDRVQKFKLVVQQ